MINQSMISSNFATIKDFEVELEGSIICDFQIKVGGKFLIYTLKEEIEGFFDKKPILVGRRPIKEPRIGLKILSNPDRVVYQIGISNDLEVMTFGTRLISNRIKGVPDTLMATEDEEIFVSKVSLTRQNAKISACKVCSSPKNLLVEKR